MLGVVMEDPLFGDGNQESATDGFSSPKQTILNFFKPSTKPASEIKPKDLFGYFAKSSKSLLSPVKPDFMVEELESNRRKEKRKRKKDDDPNNVQTSAVKKKTKSCPNSGQHNDTRESVCEGQEEFKLFSAEHLNSVENTLINENGEDDKKDGTVVDEKQLKEVCFEDYINNVCTLSGKEDVCVSETENEVIVANGNVEASGRELVENILSSNEKSPSCLGSESYPRKSNQERESVDKNELVTGSQKTTCASKNTPKSEKKSKKDQKLESKNRKGSVSESTEEEEVQEMSFHDYMQSLGDQTATDNKQKEEKTDCDIAIEKQQTKNNLDITDFFRKVDKTSKARNNEDVKTVTVSVDIHPEPMFPSPDLNEKKKRVITPDDILRKRTTKTDDEIVILGTEIIEIADINEKDKKLCRIKTANKAKNNLKVKKVKNPSAVRKGKARRSLNLKKTSAESVNTASNPSDDICVLNISDNENGVESISEAEKGNDFWKSATSVIPSKTTQSTLDFTSRSTQDVKKSVHCTRLRDSNTRKIQLPKPVSESTPLKGLRKKKEKQSKGDVHENDKFPEKCATPVNKSTRETDKHDLSAVSGKSINRKQKYEVTFLDADDKKTTPIRMKLRRCNMSSSVSDADFTPQSEKSRTCKQAAKLRTAKKLLVKAKSSKIKASAKPVGSREPSNRQECRRTQHKKGLNSSDVVILNDDRLKSAKNKSIGNSNTSKTSKSTKTGQRKSRGKELNMSDDVVVIDDSPLMKLKSAIKEMRCKTQVRSKAKDATKGLSKLAKEDSKKPPHASKSIAKHVIKHSDVKLAPIFSQTTNSEKPQAGRKVLDPEKEKIRQAFLMSGVPDELRRQSLNVTSTLEADYPPLPKVNHVQQKNNCQQTSGLDMWNLPAVNLPFKDNSDILGNLQCKNFGTLIDKNLSGISCKGFQKPQPLAKPVLECLLEEIDACGSVYPVMSMYKTLTEKKMQAENVTEKCSFFGLLSESQSKHDDKVDTAIVGNGAECNKEARGERRNLRKRRSLTDKDIEIISENPQTKDKTKMDLPMCSEAPSLLWTEKYQPCYSSEILGNEGNIKHLRAWLLEWKHRFNKEAQKMRRMMMKQSKNKPVKEKGENWLVEDSDFELGSSDSDEEENDSLCNTVLLTGPHGIGKTASVYMLSNELGFKVFEVNASSCRSGKKILSQLQEATQSLRVAHDKSSTASCSGMSSPFGKAKDPEPVEKKLPTAFANLFTKANPDTKEDTKPKAVSKCGEGKRKKRKRNEKEEDKSKKKRKLKDFGEDKNCPGFLLDEGSSTSNKGLNLTSTSLILFDEVDIVFEEDKGFWSAVQSFMASTKIPIILTASDSSFPSLFDGRYEQYSFKTPSLTQITCHLQLICLIENVRVDSKEISDLVKLYKGDIRRSLLALQYWVGSGGGISHTHKPISKSTKVNQVEVDENTNSQHSLTYHRTNTVEKSRHVVTNDRTDAVEKSLYSNDSDDFLVLKRGRRKARVFVDDDSSNSMATLPPPTTHTLSAPVLAPDQDTHLLHLLCLDTLIGSTNHMQQPLMDYLQSNISTSGKVLSNVMDACKTYKHRNCNIPYSLHLSLLPFTKIFNMNWKKYSSPVIKPEKKRLRIKNDLYDSEESDEAEMTSLDEEQKLEIEIEQHPTTMPTLDISAPVNSKENSLLKKSILEFSHFYDTMSMYDFMNSIIYKSESGSSDERYCLKDGMNDDKVDNEVDNWWLHTVQWQMGTEMEVRALHKLCCELGDVNNCIKTLLSDKRPVSDGFVLPLDREIEESCLTREDPQRFIRCRTMLGKAQKNVISSLPLWSRPSNSCIAMDYMPMLRAVGRAEQSRKEAKIKRRFHHHFDNIGLNLKRSTIDVLQSTFDT